MGRLLVVAALLVIATGCGADETKYLEETRAWNTEDANSRVTDRDLVKTGYETCEMTQDDIYRGDTSVYGVDYIWASVYADDYLC